MYYLSLSHALLRTPYTRRQTSLDLLRIRGRMLEETTEHASEPVTLQKLGRPQKCARSMTAVTWASKFSTSVAQHTIILCTMSHRLFLSDRQELHFSRWEDMNSCDHASDYCMARRRSAIALRFLFAFVSAFLFPSSIRLQPRLLSDHGDHLLDIGGYEPSVSRYIISLSVAAIVCMHTLNLRLV